MPSITRSAVLAVFFLASHAFSIVPRSATNPCEAPCAPYTNSASCTTSPTCQCTAAIAQEFQTCVNCAVSVGGQAVIQATQSTVDVYNEMCAGTSTPLVTVKGGSSSATTGGSSSGQTTITTAQGNNGNSPSGTINTGSPAQATSVAPASTGKKSGAMSVHQILSVGPHILVGCVLTIFLCL